MFKARVKAVRRWNGVSLSLSLKHCHFNERSAARRSLRCSDMPLTETERALLGRPRDEDVDHDHQRIDYAPREKSKIGRFTLVALILNRTIGSGIFLSPHRVLQGTGCVGGALCMWVLAAVISICGLYVWLECGLSMPQRLVRGENKPRGVPRSGGEKNYVSIARREEKCKCATHLRQNFQSPR